MHGVGYLGVGQYKSFSSGKKTKSYGAWQNMIGRCYNVADWRYPRYGGRGITVCGGWHNFQTYAKWYEENYRLGFVMDKDLRKPRSRVYSEETCEFIPQKVNKLLISNNKTRGSLPVGVYERRGRFHTDINLGRKRKYIGSFETSEAAFSAYKRQKEDYIKVVAKECFGNNEISEEIYNTLMDWVITPFPE
jgi:hypothetical protein